MDRRLTAIFAALVIACSPNGAGEQAVSELQGVPIKRVELERIPDMKTPRAAGIVICEGDEIHVMGGHTTGFLPTSSAEYFKNGAWYDSSPSFYPHDGGFTAFMPDGSLLVGGGSSEPFGIGQTWGVESYMAKTRKFTPAPILGHKRAYSSADVLPDGRVVVSGNWYAEDCIEIYSPGSGVVKETGVSVQRSSPFILPCGEGDALIFGALGTRYEPVEPIVDRLDGEPFFPEVFREWTPSLRTFRFFVSDYSIGKYDYLVPVVSKAGSLIRYAFVRVNGDRFSLLETTAEIPCSGIDGEKIRWGLFFHTDRSRRYAYLGGMSETGRYYFLRVDYNPEFDGGKSELAMYYTRREDNLPIDVSSSMLPDGGIVLVGGIGNDNYTPFSSCFIFRPEPGKSRNVPLGWIVLASLLFILCVFLFVLYVKKAPAAPEREVSAPVAGKDLLTRIIELMEKDRVFLRKGLTKADVAKALGTNVSYVSACINAQYGTTFPDFIADYRIRYAKDLMLSHPEKVLAEVAEDSGFANEQSFCRTFKARTGMTPQEWKKRQEAGTGRD